MRKVIWPILSLAVGLALLGCVAPRTLIENSRLQVSGGDPVVYQCENGDRIVARYYSLSDESLRFVKVTMPGGKVHTLPRAVSASGARYTDDFKVVWWTKGDSALVQIRDQDGKWQTAYRNCKEISGIE